MTFSGVLMRKNYYISENKIVPASKDDEATIIHFILPDENEKRFLIDEYRVDEHTLNSSLDPDELSRFEFEPDHTAMIYKRPKNYSAKDKLMFKVASTGLFFFKNRLIIVTDEDIPLFTLKQFSKVGSLNDTMLKLIYASIYHFLEHLKIINFISDEIEHKINTSFENKNLINLFAIEKSLVYYLNSINSNKVLIEKLKTNSAKLSLSQEEYEFLDDILIENDQCYKQAEIYSNILVGMGDARASIVNNNLNLQMKRLTIITLIFMPLNLISGIGGMSEYSMMAESLGIKNWKVSYSLFMFGLVIIGYLMWYVLKKTENIDKK
jgi:magnesium transporter